MSFRLAFVLCFLSVTSFALPERLPPLWSTWTAGSASPQALRLRAFADDARLRLDFAPGKALSAVQLTIEGPLADYGDKSAVGTSARPLAIWSGARPRAVQLALPKAGIYRLILTPTGPGADFQFRLIAGPGALRRSLPLRDFLRQIPDANVEALVQSFRPWLESLGQDPTWVARQVLVLRSALQSRNYAGLERFPTLPTPAAISSGLKKLRAQLPVRPVSFSDRVFKGESLTDLLAKATPDRAGVPPRAHPKLPADVGYGHYPDQTVPTAFAAHSPVLAEVLTSLASDNGSTVALPSSTARAPRDVFQWLLASGHRVRVLEEKSLANFLSLTHKGQPVQWTTWMKTGVALSTGEGVVIPSSHSQTTFEITGPSVHARLSFFLGMFGVGFFAAVDERPAWTGFAREAIGDSARDSQAVLRAVDLATSYHRMIREEQKTVGAGLPGGGYGLLGVCNDRAVIELALKGRTTTWPLLRPADLIPPMGTDSALVDLLARMPRDTAPFPAGQTADEYRRGAIPRVLDAVPANSTLFVEDAAFREMMAQLARD